MATGVKGVKLARYDLIPPEATWYEALVYGMGAQKYADRNWEGGYSWGSGISALERHIQLFKAREDLDEESGLPHLAHVRWHSGTLLSFIARGIGIDDRTEGANIDVLKAELLNREEIVAAKENDEKVKPLAQTGIVPHFGSGAALSDPHKYQSFNKEGVAV